MASVSSLVIILAMASC